ncbi:MAG: sigma-54 dependent transcriptional regulator [Thermodesulfobacteriota bacterium]
MKNGYDLVLIEGRVELLPTIKTVDQRAEVILLGEIDIDEVEAIKEGAAAHFPAPVDIERLRQCIDNIFHLVDLRRKTGQLERQLYDKYTFAGVVGKNPQMLDIFNLARRIAPYYKMITIMGDTGTGKEELAKALHAISPVAKNPFVVCNCGALVEGLIESELFGHKKGAFTGATTDKMGVFEAAGEGTVLLDEVGELPLSFQPHLLRVLQNGDFRRLGSTRPLKARCRVIAATNRDLSKDVKAGRFREDLFYRLTPLTITIPPLRERKDDIPLLCKFLLERACRRTGKKISGFSRPAQIAIMAYDWPGNIRELDNVIEQVTILTNEAFIRLEDLPPSIRESGSKRSYDTKSLDEVIKAHIEETLRQCNGNRSNAAKVLGISRRALLRKMEKYSLT